MSLTSRHVDSKKAILLHSIQESHHAQYQDPDTEASKWNAAPVHFITYSCVSNPAVICQNVRKACHSAGTRQHSPNANVHDTYHHDL